MEVVSIMSLIGLALALAGTIVAWILIVPERVRPRLNKFFKWVHDLFNFKSLWLEKILKFLYIFETLFCIIGGFLMLFSFETRYTSVYSYYGSERVSYTVWVGYWGLLVLFLGPIIVRILYEFVMMIILLVKNTMQINDKLNAQPGSRFEEQLEIDRQKEEQYAMRKAEQEAAKAAYAQQKLEQQMQQQMQQQQMQQYQQQQPQPQQPQYQQPFGNDNSDDNNQNTWQ